ncbi:MAG: HEAT repeat domain-containing protein [Candidatus Hodarchaeota archaeon]
MGEDIEKLVQALRVNDTDEVYQDPGKAKRPKKAIEALVRIGRPAVLPLSSLLEDIEEAFTYAIEYAIKVWGEIGDPETVQPMIRVIDRDFNEQQKWQFCNIGPVWSDAIVKIGRIAVDPLIDYVRANADNPKRGQTIYWVLDAFVNMKDEKAFNFIIEALGNINCEVVFQAVLALDPEPLGDAEKEQVVECLKRDVLDRFLGLARDEALALLGTLVDGEECQKIMENHGIPCELDYLLKHYGEIDPQKSHIGVSEKSAVIRALEALKIRDDRIFNTFIRALSDEYQVVRCAAESLGNYGDPRALDHLTQLLREYESRKDDGPRFIFEKERISEVISESIRKLQGQR